MRWEGRRKSENVEDRRSMGRTAGVALGGGGILVLILALLFGGDPQKIAKMLGQGGPAVVEKDRPKDPQEERQADFSKTIFGDTEEIWDDQFRKMGKRYEKPTLVLFSGRVESACGLASAAVGPFYCPGDGKVYIDLAFYKDMQEKLNSPGEFARAYVLAHEVGHHVQRLLGYSEQVDRARRAGGEGEFNRMSVRLELQADFLAGVWAHHAQKKFNFLDPGDVETALNAAFQIGDDRLQKQGQGYVVPEKFTHGTSKQRQRWFVEGFKTGDMNRARLLFELPYEEL
jgi:uncharacterized protein